MSPSSGVDYPGSYADLRAWFPTDGACLDYLDWLRWRDGFCCPLCGATKAWRLADGRWSCGGCARRVSATAGTIFHGTRTPLTVWFAAAWQMISQKHGISALGLKRTLGIGSEQTAWAMLHRYRTAMVRPGRDRLRGTVETDETFLGGPEPGVRGRGALGKTMVEVAVERAGHRLGRCRLQVIEDVAAATLRAFMLAHVEPGSVVVTDGLASYRPACGEDYTHRPLPIGPSGQQAHELLPGVHRVASLAKRWLLGTHQGGVKPAHLGRVPRRVRVSLQPPTLQVARDAVLPAARAGRASAATHLPLARRRLRSRPHAAAAARSRQARSPAQPGRRTTRQALAQILRRHRKSTRITALRWRTSLDD